MKKVEKKVEFDLSALNLKELIEVYQNIEDFIKYIQDEKIKLKNEEQANG